MAGQSRGDVEGIPLAVTFLVSGGLCVLAPEYFDAAGWREVAWHVGGVVLAIIGALGLVTELTAGSGSQTVSDLGMGLVLLVIAGGLSLALSAWALPSPSEGIVRGVVAISVFFAIYGLTAGTAQAMRRRRTSGTQRATRRDAAIAVAVAVIGLVTAVVNYYAAVRSIPP